MARIGFHASHEQFPSSELAGLVREAEAAGFSCAMSSDHFRPWGSAQDHSGYAWAWLGAALQATRLPFGVVSALGYRYHPALLAQPAATLAEMFPQRLWLCLGSGRRLNENLTGVAWPEKAERNARLRECADIIRALLRGEPVSHQAASPSSTDSSTLCPQPHRCSSLRPCRKRQLSSWGAGPMAFSP